MPQSLLNLDDAARVEAEFEAQLSSESHREAPDALQDTSPPDRPGFPLAGHDPIPSPAPELSKSLGPKFLRPLAKVHLEDVAPKNARNL
jgi:hypothetical protein